MKTVRNPWPRPKRLQQFFQQRIRQIGFLKHFSILGRMTFQLLVAGLAALSIGAWWAVQSSVELNQSSRLASEADRIQASITDRLNTFANSLVHVRGHFAVDGKATGSAVDGKATATGSAVDGKATGSAVDGKATGSAVDGDASAAGGTAVAERFHEYVEQLEIPRRFPGMRSIGFVALDANQTSAHVTMVEPKAWQNDGADVNPLAEPRRLAAMREAAASGEPAMTEPVTLASEASAELIFFEPLYLTADLAADLTADGSQPASGTGDRPFRRVAGFVFSSIRVTDFLEGLFGPPSLKSEDINFSITFPGAAPIYNRFATTEDGSSSLRLERPLRLFGHQAVLTLTPLPGFFTYSDRFLPLAVAFGSSFISILILLVLKASQSQLLFETRAKELSVRAMQKSREQTELLKQLNEFSRVISGELDLNRLVDGFFDRAIALSRCPLAFLYFASSETPDARLVLRQQIGFDGTGLQALRPTLKSQSLSLGEAMAILPKSFAAKKSQDTTSADTLEKLFSFAPAGRSTAPPLVGAPDFPKSYDWILLAIPSREIGRCGLIYLARPDAFEETEVEIIESFVTRAATAIENSQLFRKVEGASRAKNAFLANMSHEIRTPLNAIIGFSEILIGDTAGREQRASLARNIRKGSQQLTRIIDDILDLSRIEAGRLHIEIRRLRLETLLYEIKSVIDLRALEKHVDFRVEADGPLPTYIESDEVRLKQILMNLVGNAVKFTSHGTVKLSVSYGQRGPDLHTLIFRVKDTGSGMGEELRARLFQPFSQGDDSKTRRHGGSGLGLALSKRLCEEMGGSLVLIESAPGQGSTFEASVEAGALTDVVWTDHLSLQSPQPDPPLSTKLNSGHLAGLNVLLVEDSVDNQEIFRFFLENAGASVEIAGDGLSGVSRALAGGIDLVLMDIQIPEIDGKEATRRLRARGLKIPIVALTAHALQEERLSCLAAGCDGQITKPVSGAELVSQVADYARRTNGTHTENFGRYETALSAAPQI